MRNMLIALSLLVGSMTSAHAQISVDIAVPGIRIGIDVPVYPELVQVPGYPVYYAPRLSTNYFFYDGLYWAFDGDGWYMSSWYNGPWQSVRPEDMPLFVLRVPVRYYHQRPAYFRGWSDDAPPRWGEHWGRGWEERRSGWDRWDRRSTPRAAPLPVYQQKYSGARYPAAVERQHSIRSENYRYQPREVVAQQQFQRRGGSRPEPQRPAPERQTQPSPRVQQAQPEPGTPRVATPQAAPRDGGRERKAAPQAPGREKTSEPQVTAREKRSAPQAPGREKRSEPQAPGREKDDKAERGPDRH